MGEYMRTYARVNRKGVVIRDFLNFHLDVCAETSCESEMKINQNEISSSKEDFWFRIVKIESLNCFFFCKIRKNN